MQSLQMGLVNMELEENKSPSDFGNEASETVTVLSGDSKVTGQVTD